MLANKVDDKLEIGELKTVKYINESIKENGNLVT